MRRGVTPCSAAGELVLCPDSGGIVSVSGRTGQVVMDFNSLGMFRGWAARSKETAEAKGYGVVGGDSSELKREATVGASAVGVGGVGQVGIWEELVDVDLGAGADAGAGAGTGATKVSEIGGTAAEAVCSSPEYIIREVLVAPGLFSAASTLTSDASATATANGTVGASAPVHSSSSNTSNNSSSSSNPQQADESQQQQGRDGDILHRIGQLRYRVWGEEEGSLDVRQFPDRAWVDDSDCAARHWVAEDRATGELVGAARLTLHSSPEDQYRDMEIWRRAGKPLPLPTADLGRLVVLRSCRGRGVAQQLNRLRMQAAQEMGAASMMVTASAGNARLLQKLGFQDIGVDPVFFADRPTTPFYAMQYNF
jgi:predicted GNAT family N-acyltransferase